MAGLTLAQRDLAETREQLHRWFERELGRPIAHSELSQANASIGWSSESLLFSIDPSDANLEGRGEFVIRIPPAGGGIYAEYDLEGQTKTHELLRRHGIAAPSPARYEPDSAWIGSKFMVMPRIVGHTPAEVTYATTGWLHDAGTHVQRRVHDGFLDTLLALQRIPAAEAPWLERPGGAGAEGELEWWREFVDWGTDGATPDLVIEAFDWLQRKLPTEPTELGVSWGDPRFSNVMFDDTGAVAGVLDWEQACLCPAEADLAWWLTTRRNTMAVCRITADPELPGFDSRADAVRRFEEMIGRPLVAMDWYEVFAAVRMGCCLLRMQVLLRSTGQDDHPLANARPLPKWTVEAIRA
jgi:aminoglycoside phosphotransferase (APT) family kinase protein